MPKVDKGVFPVYYTEFKIGTAGRESTEEDMKEVKDLTSFSISIDGNIEEWTPMDTDGWVRRLMTGKGFVITLNGKRHVGDPGNDYISNTAFKGGLECSSKLAIVFPNGDTLEFDCILDVKNPGSGESTDVAELEIEAHSDGKPEYKPAV